MTPLRAETMKKLGARRLRRRALVRPEAQAAGRKDPKDLETLELKEILTLYKKMFNTDPPRKNKFLMVKKIKEAGGPVAKTKATGAMAKRTAVRKTRKEVPKAGVKGRASRSSSSGPPKAKAKPAPKAKWPRSQGDEDRHR